MATALLMVALTMMSPNCSGLLSRPKVSIGNSKSLTRVGWRLTDPSRRRIQVLVAYRIGDIDGGNIAGRHFLGI